MNNIISIDEKEFTLPMDRETRRSVLNHLRLCLEGRKSHMRFQDKYGDWEVYSALELQSAVIMVGDRELKLEMN